MRYLASLRFRILVIIVLAMVPAAGLLLFSYQNQRRDAEARLAAEAEALAELVASRQSLSIRGTYNLLAVLSQGAIVREPARSTSSCSVFFSGLVPRLPAHSNIAVADLDGDVRCSGIPLTGPVNIADRAWFQRTLATGNAALGDYQIGRITGRPTLNLAYPVRGADGSIEGVLFAAIDGEWLAELLRVPDITNGTTLTLLDTNGAVLAQSPHAAPVLGQLVATFTNVRRDASTVSHVRTRDSDGVERLYAVRPLDFSPGADLVVIAGLPLNEAMAGMQQAFLRNLFGIVVLGSIALVAASFMADLLVLQPTLAILRAVREVAAGNYAARSGLGKGKSELDELGRSFDQMAEALEKRERERDEAEELRLRVRLAEESEQAKSEVLRTVSHELRTPLATVRGFASLLSEYWDSLGADERTAYLGDIEDAAVRMEKLVADLLTLSRIEAKALNLDLQPVTVREMFEAAKRAAKAIERRARVETAVLPGAETVRADWTSAQQLLLNLLENSLKYGNPRAPIELTAEPDGAGMVRIRVRDHGPGVSHEDLATLFEPFFRSREAQVRARGTGLGLPICKGLVEAHGGEISVNLPPDGGLEVNFTLPVAR